MGAPCDAGRHMKLFSRVLFVIFVLLGVLVAVSNREPVELGLWPLPQVVVTPLYLVIVAVLLIGILAGLGLGWWAGRHHRRRARTHRSEAARLDRENAKLRETIASHAPPPSSAAPAAHEQRAIDRQSALVAPELLPPTARSLSA
jgi:uncharacterized integral membrane protein